MNSLSTLEVKFQPLVLKIHITKAQNVPVGDIRSSDPYCILHIGPNRVGQTTVRTWTLNPTWNETFTIPLLHLKHPLVIEIWDFDSVGSDDILGKVELNLGDLPSNCKVEHKLNLERASDTINPRGVLYLDAFLERKDTLIDVEASGRESGEGNMESSSPLSQLPDNTVEVIQGLLEETNTPKIFHQAFFQSNIVRSEVLHWSYYRDLLYDLNHLFTSKTLRDSASAARDADDFSKLLHMKIKRNLWDHSTPRPTHSVRIHLKTNSVAPSCYPPNGYSVVLETSAETFTFLALNRFLYWDFIKSLRRMYFIGVSRFTQASSLLRRLHFLSEDEDKDESWQGVVHFSSKLKVLALNKSQVYLCRLHPVLLRLVMLDVETNTEVFHISLDTIEYMHLGLEFEEYKPYDLKLNITSGKLPRKVVPVAGRDPSGSNTVAPSSSSDSSGKWYPGKNVARAIRGTGSLVKNSVADVSHSVTSAASTVLSAIAPKSIQTKIMVNFPNTCEFETHLLEGHGPYWDETCHHRLHLSDISSTPSGGRGVGDKSHGHAEDEDVAVGVHVHLMTEEGVDQSPLVLGSRFIRYSELIPSSAVEGVSETTTSCQGGKASDDMEQSYLIDSSISFHIRVVRGEDLLPPESSVLSMETILTTTTDSFLTGVDMMTSAVVLSQGNENTDKLKSVKYSKELLTNRKPCVVASFAKSDRTIPAEYAAYRTKSINDTCDPVWKENIVLQADDGLYSAQAVVLQVTDRFRKHTVEGKMGEAVIPVASFFSEKMVSGETVFKRLPVLPATGMQQAVETFVEGSLGYLLVEIKLCVEKSEISDSAKTKESPPLLNLKTQVQSTSEYSTVFPCEVVARSSMAQKHPEHVEIFHVAPGHEGLVFFGEHYRSASSVDLKENATQALLHQFQRHSTIDGVEFIEYHVFENERRVLFEWGSRNLMLFERSAYTEESGTISCPFSNHVVKFKPPAGYVWQDDSKDQWLVDREYTNTDEDGWVYGSDFGYVMQNLRLGKSTTTSQLRSVRRRRWKRIAVKEPVQNVTVSVKEFSKDVETIIEMEDIDSSLSGAESGVVKSETRPHETFHVFYNQRRAVLSLSFGPNNLFPTDRYEFTDESGQIPYPYCSDIEDMRPPAGYQWVEGSKWTTDQTYTPTDEFGWTYAVDFHFLESNLRKGKSSTSSTFQSVRRRKYCRNIVAVDLEDISNLVERDGDIDDTNHSSEQGAAAPTTKLQAYMQNKEQILGLCKEKESLKTPVFIPWNQVQRIDVVSPSVLSLGITVHRFFGEDVHGLAIYREVELEVFVVECPAERLCALMGDRLHFFQLRGDLKTLLTTGSMTGDSNDVGYCESSGLVSQDDGGGNMTVREFSLGTRTIERLYIASIQIELELKKLTEEISTLGSPAMILLTQVEILHQSRLHGRIKLYIALLLAASLFGPSYEDEDIKRVIAADKMEAITLFESATDDQAAKQTVSFLLDMAEMRVRDYALCGWSHQGNLLESCLRSIINGYYINIVEALGYFFDSKDALESLKGNESKLKLIEFVIENDNHFNLLVENSLLPYNLKISPPPLLSLSLNTKSLLNWYSELLSEEMQGYVRRTFEVTLSSVPPNMPNEYFLPWEIISDNGALISSIPVDTGNILRSFLSLTTSRFNKQFVSAEVKAGMAIIEGKIQLLYVECLTLLVRLYYDFLSGHDWTTPMPLTDSGLKYDEDIAFQAVGDHLAWLTSVTNDCFRMSHLLLDSASELNEMEDASTSAEKKKELECLRAICSKELARTSNLSLEFLSCIIFKSFEGIVPTIHIFDSWSMNTNTVEKFVGECMWYLTSRFEFLEKPCRIVLLEICLKKVVAWYLYFLKECADNSIILFSDEHYMRVEADVKTIVEAFTEQNGLVMCDDVDSEDNRISHELQRFQQIFVLLAEPIGAVEYTVAICNILDDVKKYPGEGKAMSSCMKAIFKLTQRNADFVPNVVNEFGVHPEEYIKTMTAEMTAAAATLLVEENRQLSSLGAYVLVFEALVKPTDYFIHSATYVMKSSEDTVRKSASPEKTNTEQGRRRSSIMQFKKFLHLK